MQIELEDAGRKSIARLIGFDEAGEARMIGEHAFNHERSLPARRQWARPLGVEVEIFAVQRQIAAHEHVYFQDVFDLLQISVAARLQLARNVGVHP